MTLQQIIDNINQVSTALVAAGQSPLGQFVLQALKERFGAELSDADVVRLDEHFAQLELRAAESRQQAGG